MFLRICLRLQPHFLFVAVLLTHLVSLYTTSRVGSALTEQSLNSESETLSFISRV